MKNNFLKKVAAIAFGVFAASAVTSSAFAIEYFGENDELDGCKIGYEREFAEVKELLGYTPEGFPIYIVTEISWCKKIPPKPTIGF